MGADELNFRILNTDEIKLKGVSKKFTGSSADCFEIFDIGEADTEFIKWLFNTKSTDYSALPENTSLQSNMKIHLLSGGIVRNT